MKIVGTGLNGLVGSRITELLGSSFEFENISRQTGVDIANKDQIEHAIDASDSPLVLHLAAKTDVDGCEKDKTLGKDGEAWRINVIGTQNVAEACRKFNKKLLYVSTDFVFDGIHPPDGGYSETDTPSPVDWYGITKYEGEKIVQAMDMQWIIARISYPYRARFEKKDFFRAMLERLQNGQQVTAVSDGIFTPTFIDDIARAFAILISQNHNGIFHVTGSQSLSPYAAACSIADMFNVSKNSIQKTTQEEFFKNRAKRPFQGIIKNAKIQRLNASMSTFEEGIAQIQAQLHS